MKAKSGTIIIVVMTIICIIIGGSFILNIGYFSKDSIEGRRISKEAKTMANDYIKQKYNFNAKLIDVELERGGDIFGPFHYTGTARLTYSYEGTNFFLVVDNSHKISDTYQSDDIINGVKNYMGTLIPSEIDYSSSINIGSEYCFADASKECKFLFGINEYYDNNPSDFIKKGMKITMEINFIGNDDNKELIQDTIFELSEEFYNHNSLSLTLRSKVSDLKNDLGGDMIFSLTTISISNEKKSYTTTFNSNYGVNQKTYDKLMKTRNKLIAFYNFNEININYWNDIKLTDDFNLSVNDISFLSENSAEYKIDTYNLQKDVSEKISNEYNCKSILTYGITNGNKTSIKNESYDKEFNQSLRSNDKIYYYFPNSEFIYINHDLSKYTTSAFDLNEIKKFLVYPKDVSPLVISQISVNQKFSICILQ